jgi:putative hydrolase of the HAD superfamily
MSKRKTQAGPIYLEHPQSVRAVFFDAGFTLLAPHPSIMEIAAQACAEQGIPAEVERLAASLPAAEASLRARAREAPWAWSDEATIMAMWTHYFAVLLRDYLAELSAGGAETLVQAVVRAYEHAANYALYPDVIPTLRALKERGMTLGVISDWGIGLGLILRHHDLVQYFDFAVVSAAVRLAKPDPRLFETALQRADAIGDFAVHIGDSYVLDVLGARAAGITPILIDRNRRYDPRQLDCLVVSDLYGLLDLLEVPHLDAAGDLDDAGDLAGE